MSLFSRILPNMLENSPQGGFIAKRNNSARTFDKPPLGLSKSESPTSPELGVKLPAYSPKVRKDLEVSSKEQKISNFKNNPPKVVKNLERMQPFIRRHLKTAKTFPQVAKQERSKSARLARFVIDKS